MKTRTELEMLATYALKEIKKINKHLDEVFKKCEEDIKEKESKNKRS